MSSSLDHSAKARAGADSAAAGAERPGAANSSSSVHSSIPLSGARRTESADLWLASIVDSSTDAIIGKDLDGTITSWNKAAQQLFGYSAEEVVGRSVALLIPDDRQQEEKHILERIRHGDRVEPFETVRTRKDGRAIEVSVTISPVKDPGGKVIGASKIARDITERKRMEKAINESDDRFRNVIQSAMDAIITIDGQQKILMFNATAETMFSCQAKNAIGKNIESFIPHRFRQAHAGHIRRFAETGVTSRGMGGMTALWGLRADGTEFPIEASISQVISGGERLFSVILRDITERRRMEEALRESEDRFRGVIESATDAVITVDAQQRIMMFNAAAAAMFLCPAGEAIGKTLDRFLPERYRAAHAEHIRRFGQTGVTSRKMGSLGALWGLRGNGEEFPIEASISQVSTSKESLFSVILRDITERKRAEADLQKHQADLDRSNRDLEQFAYAASHDLQEPLRAVAGCMHLLQARYQDKIDERANEYIHHAVDGASRMQNLIDDLLSFSRVGTRGGEFQAVACEKAVETALKNLSAAMEETQTRVECDTLPVVSGDLLQLSLLFQNLIGNAIKFRGPMSPSIHIGAERNGTGWTISVRDNGIGIDPQYFDRIFVIFQRLHTRKEYPGTGMGLALCKKIVERHGGRIWVESEFGKGTTFYFVLPARSADQARVS
jgi:PAS domain S-box-containing protein